MPKPPPETRVRAAAGSDWQALSLLLVGGLMLAIIVNLSKGGARLGLSAAQITFFFSLGGGTLLLGIDRFRAHPPLRGRHLRAYAALGAVSYAVPTTLGAVVAARVGAGFASVLISLSPVLTFALAVLLGMQGMSRRQGAGLLLGLVGTWLLVLPGLTRPEETAVVWMLLGLVIPASLATGNILRTRLVPVETPNRLMVIGVLLAAALYLAPFALSTPLSPAGTGAAAALLAAGALVTAGFNLVLFQLQKVAGPVRLSQVGYVAAAFGILVAAVAFGERPRPSLLAAVAFIVAGIRLVNAARPSGARTREASGE